MEPIKNSIQALMRSLKNKSKGIGGEPPEKLLQQVFSRKEAAHVKFGYLKKNIIGIKVDSATWHYYLNLKKEQLLAQLRAKKLDIKDIHFYIGDVG